MKLVEEIQKYPKAAERFYTFSAQSLARIQELEARLAPAGAEVEVPEIPMEVSKSFGDITLQYNWRALYDFLDAEGVRVEVYSAHPDQWGHRIIDSVEDIMTPYKFKTRIEAEFNGFTAAFSHLENQLNNL